MQVKLIAKTPNIETTIVEVARVSSSRKDKTAKPEGLLNYLIRHKHWSPFEHGYITMEIETSKAIGIQLIRHRSFTFQEFSQRYQDVNQLGDMFEHFHLRKQAEDNRQSSTERFDPTLLTTYGGEEIKASQEVYGFMQMAEDLYNRLLDAGVARETARMILPMCTKTKIYMTGSVRSWIHFLQIRDDEHAQKEIQEIAQAIKMNFIQELPIISRALGYDQEIAV